MKRKKGLFAVVAALAVSSVMAAMAYTTANVVSPVTLTVSSTDSALIQFNPLTNVGNEDDTAYVQDGMLKLHPGLGRGGNVYGLQPNSDYIWNPMFKVTNNSRDRVQFWAYIQNPPTTARWRLDAKSEDGSKNAVIMGYNSTDSVGDGRRYTLEPGEVAYISLEMDLVTNLPSNAGTDLDINSNIIFSAQAIN